MATSSGYVIGLGAYDEKLYCIGKGPTETTVMASPKVSAHGSSVLIEGSVRDMSPATQEYASQVRFPNGVPAVADEDMNEFMDYLYMQNATLLNNPPTPDGVPVKLFVVKPDGTEEWMTTVTSDSYGNYKYDYVPSAEGVYSVIAKFEGSETYWPSSTETSFIATPAAAPGGVIEPEQPLISTDMAIIIAVIAVAIIAAVAYVFLRRKQSVLCPLLGSAYCLAVPFTPVGGQRLLVHPSRTGDAREAVLGALARGLQEASRGCFGMHVLFDTAEEVDWLDAHGLFPRLQYQFHWNNDGYDTFEDWLKSFSSDKRNKIRRGAQGAPGADPRGDRRSQSGHPRRAPRLPHPDRLAVRPLGPRLPVEGQPSASWARRGATACTPWWPGTDRGSWGARSTCSRGIACTAATGAAATTSGSCTSRSATTRPSRTASSAGSRCSSPATAAARSTAGASCPPSPTRTTASPTTGSTMRCGGIPRRRPPR